MRLSVCVSCLPAYVCVRVCVRTYMWSATQGSPHRPPLHPTRFPRMCRGWEWWGGWCFEKNAIFGWDRGVAGGRPPRPPPFQMFKVDGTKQERELPKSPKDAHGDRGHFPIIHVAIGASVSKSSASKCSSHSQRVGRRRTCEGCEQTPVFRNAAPDLRCSLRG